jgi:hypothetical protein
MVIFDGRISVSANFKLLSFQHTRQLSCPWLSAWTCFLLSHLREHVSYCRLRVIVGVLLLFLLPQYEHSHSPRAHHLPCLARSLRHLFTMSSTFAQTKPSAPTYFSISSTFTTQPIAIALAPKPIQATHFRHNCQSATRDYVTALQQR